MTQLQPTGLITSGPLGSSAGNRSEPAAGSGKKPVYGPAVTNLNGEVRLGFKVSKAVMWVVFVAAVMVVVVGAFLMVAVEKKEVVAVVAGGVLAAVVAVGVWNCAWKEKGLVGSLRRYPDDELRGAVDGQYVKVTGVISLSLCTQTWNGYLLGSILFFLYLFSFFLLQILTYLALL